jgi:hypothetical protein
LEKVDFIVCAATATKEPLNDFANALSGRLRNKGKSASNAVFSPEFVTEGAFDTFFGGKGGGDVEAMPLSSMSGKLFLARCDESTAKASTTIAGLYNSTVKMSFGIVDATDGKVVDGFQLSVVGPGTSEADAKAAALDQILEQLDKRGY